MIKQTVSVLATLASLVLSPLSQVGLPQSAETFLSPLVEINQSVLAEKELDLTTRAKSEYVNRIFVDNILLSLRYLAGEEKKAKPDWEGVYQPFAVSFILEPGETFAFHQTTYSEFDEPQITMNSKYSVREGYKVLAGLAGNGVCHLASLMNWAAQEAGLEVVAKVRHDFAPIPEVPRENGTSIRCLDKNQNLYIKNTFDKTVVFTFQTDSKEMNLKIWTSKI